MSEVIVFSGGAAQAFVTRQAPVFLRETGFAVAGTFDAVGAIVQRLRNREVADVAILTAAAVDALVAAGLLVADGRADLGSVATAVAIRAGDPPVAIADAQDLRAAFRAADAIYLPDTIRSTAGIHMAKVIEGLGLADEVGPKLRIFANGTAAMSELAASSARRPLGCTQATEILATAGVSFAGGLPAPYGLATVYTVAATAAARHPQAAQALIRMLTDPAGQEVRAQLGFSQMVPA